jgi:DNA-binding CsgD family transcriptional regulator
VTVPSPPTTPSTVPVALSVPTPRIVPGATTSLAANLVRTEAVEALRRIATRLESGTASVNCAPEEGVLLDTVVGGVRCLLQLHRPPEIEALSPREGQIARMVADGRTNRAIATALEISLWTVSTHLRRIFAKLGVGSRAEMVAHLYGRPGLPQPPRS